MTDTLKYRSRSFILSDQTEISHTLIETNILLQQGLECLEARIVTSRKKNVLRNPRATMKLRSYSQSNHNVVLTDQPLREILQHMTSSRRLVK